MKDIAPSRIILPIRGNMGRDLSYLTQNLNKIKLCTRLGKAHVRHRRQQKQQERSPPAEAQLKTQAIPEGAIGTIGTIAELSIRLQQRNLRAGVMIWKYMCTI